MKNLLLTLLFLGIIFPLSAQIVFSKVYDLDEHMDIAHNIVPIDGIFISVGLADNFFVGTSGLGVLATDLLGNKIWSFTIDGFAKLRLNIITSDEDFVYVAINDLRGPTPEEKIIRIASDGSYDFIDPFQTYGLFLENPTIWQLYKTPTGFIAGINERFENPTRSRYSVIEYDENFVPQSLVLCKDLSEFFITRRLKYDPTGGYVASGNTVVLNEFIQILRKVDEAGNIQWTYELPGSNEFFIESPMIVNEAGEIIIAYIQESYNPITASLEAFTVLTKLSPDGEVLWETELSEDVIFTNNLFLTENEDIILVGRGTLYPLIDGPLGKIIRLDQAGNIIWSRIYNDDRYGGINRSELYNGFEMDNGDLVFAGTTIDTINNIPLAHQDFWLLRVGPDGCYIPDCDYYNEITPVEALVQLVENNYFLTPTVATNAVKIQAKNNELTATQLSVSVVNISGQRMFSKQNHTLPYNLDITTYPPGFYFVTLTNDTGQIQTLKFVKP